MSLNFCDLLVLGSDLSGIITSVLLAKRGMNVLILDDEDDREPHPNLVTGLGSRSFKSLLGKLMIPDSRLQILRENRVACQVALPRHRLDLHTSRPLFLKEIDREFPQEKQPLEDLLVEIDSLREKYMDDILSFFPLVGEKEKRRFAKWFQRLPDEKALGLWQTLSPSLQCLLKAQMRFFSQTPLGEPQILSLLLFLPPEAGNSFSIRGGVRELKRLFFDKLDYFGGMVHPMGEDPFRIVSKGWEVRGVRMERYNFPTRCRYLIGNGDIPSLYRLLPSPFLASLWDRSRKKGLALRPEGQRCLVQYRTRRDLLPEPMKENVVLIGDPSQPLEGLNYLELNFHPIPKPESGGPDTLLSVSYSLAPQPASSPLDIPFFESIHREIDQRVSRLIPFSNGQMERFFPRLAPADKELDLFPGAGDRPFFQKMIGKRLVYPPSLFFPQIASRFRNLFFLGPNLLDRFGMEGKMQAALRVVDLVWSREVKSRNS